MSDYFGDASYWLALVDESDQYHEVATQYSTLLALENVRIITSQMVLNEVLTPRSGTTPERRQDTVGLVDQILRDPNVHVVPQLPEQFEGLCYCSAPGRWTRNGASRIAPVSW